MSYCRKHCI